MKKPKAKSVKLKS